MASKNGVYYDLFTSPWRVTRYGLTFCFSSQCHYDRFLREVDARETRMTETMSHRVGCLVDMRLAACVQLYRQVEQRGFLMRIPDGLFVDTQGDGRFEEVWITCPDLLGLDGLRASARA